MAYPTDRLFVHCFQIELEFRVLVFVEGGKPENPDKNPRSKDENQVLVEQIKDGRHITELGRTYYNCKDQNPHVRTEQKRCGRRTAFER